MRARGTTRTGRDNPLLRGLVERVGPPAGGPPPVRLAEVELSRLPPALAPGGPAHVLVRQHGRPLGLVQLAAAPDGVAAADLRRVAEEHVGDLVTEHLAADGLPTVDAVPPGGTFPCVRRLRERAASRTASVVVPTHERPEAVLACVRSLLALDHPAFEVVVVDNARRDTGTERGLRERFGGDDRVRYVREPVPGASRARNRGAVVADGEIVAFTDDDAEVDPGWLTALVAGFAEGPDVACVTGLTLPTALETPAQQAFEQYGGMSLGFARRRFDAATRAETRLYPYTAGIFGASNNAAFDRARFLRRGGFDVRLGPATPAFGAEDLDAFLAVIRAGDTLVYEPAAMVRHQHRREFPELYWQVFTYSAGFTAMLTKWAVTDRAAAADLARRVPALLPAALLDADRGGAEVPAGGYGSRLRWLERAGYLYGPFAYARSRLSVLPGSPDG